MVDNSGIDYSSLDGPDVTLNLFHPRKDSSRIESTPSRKWMMIPVEPNVEISGCFHQAGKKDCTILFFHGNGEIVSDYNELALFYTRNHINFFAVDYRGYGRSTGTPSVTAMMQDCHKIFEFTRRWLAENSYKGPLLVMGRSLGSASALELAHHYPDRIQGLIIESGFAYAAPLLRLLGIDPDVIGFREETGFSNLEKIRQFEKPLLVIHAEYDHIIPISDGLALYHACPSVQKKFLKIHGANHNDIFFHGMNEYMTAIKLIAEVCLDQWKFDD